MPQGPFPVAFPAPKATENNYFPVPAAKKPLFPQQQRRLYLLFSHTLKQQKFSKTHGFREFLYKAD